MYNKLFAILISILFFPEKNQAQLKWNIIPDTISLNPEVISFQGSLLIKGVYSDGNIGINFKDKEIVYTNSESVFRFDKKEIGGVLIPEVGTLLYNEIFLDSIANLLLMNHRKKIYQTLPLNEVIFSLAKKKPEYIIENGKIKIVGETKSKGKICSVTTNEILILGEDGEISNLKSKDFNFLDISGKRFFNTISFYSNIYDHFQSDLQQSIELWKKNIATYSIEKLIKEWGAVTKVVAVTNQKRILSWERNSEVYTINLSSSNYTNKTNFGTTREYSEANWFSSLFGSASMFISSNYLSLNNYISNSNFSVEGSHTNYSGNITATERKVCLSVLVNSDNVIEAVFHDNYFSNLKWGAPFKFIAN